MKQRCSNPMRNQLGFSLLEVLITVLIFSIGALALSALQIKAKQMGYEAIQRTTATTLANDLLERMRMNSIWNPLGGSGTGASPLADYVGSNGLATYNSSTTPTTPSTDCSTTACTENELAAYDLYEWFNRVLGTVEQKGGNSVGGLVNPTACLSGPATGSAGNYTVVIAWEGRTKLTNTNTSTCGNGTYGTNNEYRRILSVSTYIATQ